MVIFYFILFLYFFSNLLPHRYKVGGDQGEADGVERGEIELFIHWRFNPKSIGVHQRKISLAGAVAKIGALTRLEGDEESEADDEGEVGV